MKHRRFSTSLVVFVKNVETEEDLAQLSVKSTEQTAALH